jgi:sulfhydrogenase subunit alpha
MHDNPRTIRVPILTRVEGEGALNIRLHEDQVQDVQLNIYEPPRFFEALLKGRPADDVPDITSRICGICPIAYQVTAAQALEQCLGLQLPNELTLLRRLIYCAEWIESHVLHIHLLHAPDFFNCHSALDLAKQFPNEIQRGLKLKQLGNRILEVLGGRAIHPINIAIGGFHRLPKSHELSDLIPPLEQGLSLAVDATRWLATLPFPDERYPYDFVSLTHPEHYPIESGQIAIHSHNPNPSLHNITIQPPISIDNYEYYFEEIQVPHSTALQSRRIRNLSDPCKPKTYFVGPLARLFHNHHRLSPTALRLFDELQFDPSECNPYHSILARALEVVFAFEESIRILKTVRKIDAPKIRKITQAGTGLNATEAPRGLIFHRYKIDEQACITFAKIVPPTSQNQGQIESDLRSLLQNILHQDDQQIAAACERLVRTYDPCISCSTHFLKVHIERS